jgi:hypothetical protein
MKNDQLNARSIAHFVQKATLFFLMVSCFCAQPLLANSLTQDQWVRFPEITGFSVSNGEPLRIIPEKDRSLVAIFIASYDIGSQNVIEKIKKLQARYEKKFASFVYVFVNDLTQEAANFVRAHAIDGTVVLADDQTKKNFQFPPLNIPMVYISDRKGWMAIRLGEVDQEKLLAVENYLELITAL